MSKPGLRMTPALFALISLACWRMAAGFQIGVTHTGTDWSRWSDPVSVARAESLLREGAITWQSQGVVGSGGMWLPSKTPPTTPGGYDWSSLDYRVQAMRNASAVRGRMVLRLFDAPQWMDDPNATKRGLIAPDHFADFAEFCGQVAARYPDVGHFLVWNEMDGFISGSDWNAPCPNMTMNGPSYTELFRLVSRAVKAKNPSAKVGGPYVPISSAQCDPGAAGEVSGPWGAVNKGVLDFIKYFVEHAAGDFDFFAMDGHLAYKRVRLNGTSFSPPATADPRNSTEIFPAITAWVRESSGLRAEVPIWWAEMYPVPCFDTTAYEDNRSWPVEEQLAVYTKAVKEISAPELGVEVFLNWGAEANSNCFAAMYNDTKLPGGGYPTPFYDIARKFNSNGRQYVESRTQG